MVRSRFNGRTPAPVGGTIQQADRDGNTVIGDDCFAIPSACSPAVIDDQLRNVSYLCDSRADLVARRGS
jgi:hypothetical protein